MLRSIIVIEHSDLTDAVAVARRVRAMLTNPTQSAFPITIAITDRVEGSDHHVFDDKFMLMPTEPLRSTEALGAEIEDMRDRRVPRYETARLADGVETRQTIEAGASVAMTTSLGSMDTVTIEGLPEGAPIQNGTYKVDAVSGGERTPVTISVGGVMDAEDRSSESLTAPPPTPGDAHEPVVGVRYTRYPNETGVPEGYCIVFVHALSRWSFTRPDGELHYGVFYSKTAAIEATVMESVGGRGDEPADVPEPAPRHYHAPQEVEALLKEKLEEALDAALHEFPDWRNKFHPLQASKGKAAVAELVGLIFGVRSELGRANDKNVTN